MIIITGAAGFIGSDIALHLAQNDAQMPLVLVDKLKLFDERRYTTHLKGPIEYVEANRVFLSRLLDFKHARLVIHMGAITNTAAKDVNELKMWNVDYTKSLWQFCTTNQIPFIYASSAATYGSGAEGFSDEHETTTKLKPLNLYGQSKHEFDLFALSQTQGPPQWYGLKFFNVFGKNEGHKGRMASSIWHGYNEIKKSQTMTLFKSHNHLFKDGEQSRDFIYINDILSIIDFLIQKKPANGLYNCGTGEAGKFIDLAHGLFDCLRVSPKINWIDTPAEFRSAYQYRTQAEVGKLRAAGYTRAFTSLSDGIKDYFA